MFTEESIAVNVTVENWEEAVRTAGQLLVKSGAAEPRYIDAMIKTAKELGPYIVLMPGVAMPHARPEEGAIQEGFSLVTLRKPVYFGNPDNDPVKVVIAFCAPDSSKHIESLAWLAKTLEREDFLDHINHCTSAQQILELFQGAAKGKTVC